MKGVICMAKEILFSDLGSCFGPQSNVSTWGYRDKWRAIPYRTGEITGTILSSLNDGMPEDVEFDPQLTGWYKIYICLPAYPDQEVHMKLTQDEGFFELVPLARDGLTFIRMEESFWRFAKMDGQKVILSKKAFSPRWPKSALLAWLRFVEMTEEEVAKLMDDRSRQDTRVLYCTDDIHNKLYEGNMDAPGFWEGVVCPYEDSDAEWLSMERITSFISGHCPNDDVEGFAFPRSGDRGLQEQRDRFHSPTVLGKLVKLGKEKGLKMSLALRMGAWGVGFPFDQCYFDYPEYLAQPQYRCVMRDGVPAAAWSYAYEEVQQKVIAMLLEMAESGCDAVTLIAHRGIPYVLYEEPVAERFRAQYGEDPYDLPLDEPRINALHCEIMTEFFRKIRKALDEAHPDRHVQVHLRALLSVYDNKYIGLDVEKLLQEKLLDAVIPYPNRYREVYGPGCILPNGRVDMEKYKAWVNNPDIKPYIHQGDLACFEPVVDSRGVLQGPATVTEQVQQWAALEKQYGVPMYIDIMPRQMPPKELRRRAQEIYGAGGERLALWDTFGRVTHRAMWNMARQLGHKEELPNIDPETRIFQLQELAGNDISRYLPVWGG